MALGHPRRSGDLISSCPCPAASPPGGSPLLPPGAWGSARDPRATGASLSKIQGLGVPEDLQVVPAVLLQPFHVLLQVKVAQAPAEATALLALVAGPLSGAAMLVSIRHAPRHFSAELQGWLQGAVGLAQQGLLAVPSMLGGCPVQLAQARRHVQCRQRAVTQPQHVPRQDG